VLEASFFPSKKVLAMDVQLFPSHMVLYTFTELAFRQNSFMPQENEMSGRFSICWRSFFSSHCINSSVSLANVKTSGWLTRNDEFDLIPALCPDLLVASTRVNPPPTAGHVLPAAGLVYNVSECKKE